MSKDLILNAFRVGEIVDVQQVEELERWRVLDFVDEPASCVTSRRSFVIVCGCRRMVTTLAGPSTARSLELGRAGGASGAAQPSP